MKNKTLKVLSGVLLIIAAINLAKTSVYTSIKGLIIDIGGSIGLAVAIAIGLVLITLASGAVILRRA